MDEMTPERIAEMLKTCLREVESESGAKFIESLAKQWDEDRGWLSHKQLLALRRWYENL
jgi:hypothetical protein